MSDLVEILLQARFTRKRDYIFLDSELEQPHCIGGSWERRRSREFKRKERVGKTKYKKCRQSNRSKKARNYKDTNLRIDPSTNPKKWTV